MQKYSKYKSKRLYVKEHIAPALKNAGLNDLAERLLDCGDIIRVATCDYCGAKHFAGNASRCMSRFCPSCARMRSNAWCVRLIPVLKDWRDSGKYLFSMGLTIRDTERLADGLDIIKKAWRNMVHDDKSSRKVFKSLFCGGIRSIEVKTGKNSRLWHPHIHSIVLKDHFSNDFNIVRELWNKAVIASGGEPGDSEKGGSVYMHGFRTDKTIIENVMETVKYITKAKWDNEPKERIVELVSNTKNLRNIQGWGVLARLPKEVIDESKTLNERILENKVCKICNCSELTLDKLWNNAELDLHDLSDINDVPESKVHTVPKPETYEQMIMPLSRYGSWLGDEE